MCLFVYDGFWKLVASNVAGNNCLCKNVLNEYN
jgi:hypothetical protein